MTTSVNTYLTFHTPLPLDSLPFRISRIPLARQPHTSFRCTAQPPQQHNTTTRRNFLAHLLSTFFLISTPSHAQQSLDTPPESLPIPAQSPPRGPTWGYAPENGPETWADLSEDWNIASTGDRQSPIPLSYRTSTSPADIPRPALATNPAKFTVRLRNLPSSANPSLCVQPYVPPPPPLVGDAPPVDTYTPPPIPALVTLPAYSVTYALTTLHFHVAAEHVFESNPAPMEVHFIFEKVLRKPPSPSSQPPPPLPAPVKEDTDSLDSSTPTASVSSSVPSPIPPADAAEELATTSNSPGGTPPATTLVVAMLATLAKETAPWLSSLLRDFTDTAGEDGKGPGIVIDLDMASVLPSLEQSDLYMYKGSLTTPPCTEGVQWLVLSTRFPVTQSHVDAIMAIQGGPNSRPLQQVNGRRVTRFPAPLSSN